MEVLRWIPNTTSVQMSYTLLSALKLLSETDKGFQKKMKFQYTRAAHRTLVDIFVVLIRKKAILLSITEAFSAHMTCYLTDVTNFQYELMAKNYR